MQDTFIACVDGLKGFPEAIETVFPHTTEQLCILHMVRHSLNYVSWERRAEVAADLKRIYACATVEEAEHGLPSSRRSGTPSTRRSTSRGGATGRA